MDGAFLAVVATAGVALGMVNSIAGGGSLLFFPTLLGLGLPSVAANVTNAVVVLPGFAGAVYGFRTDIGAEPRARIRLLSLVTAAGAAVGSVLLLITPKSTFDLVVPALVLFASVLIAAQRQLKRLLETSEPRRRGRSVTMAVAMFAACVYGGYFNGALGVIMLMVLGLTTADSLPSLNALKAWLSLVVSVVSLPIFVLFGPVNWGAVAIGAPAALCGGYVGARIARKLSETVLRWCVVVIGITVSVYLFVF